MFRIVVIGAMQEKPFNGHAAGTGTQDTVRGSGPGRVRRFSVENLPVLKVLKNLSEKGKLLLWRNHQFTQTLPGLWRAIVSSSNLYGSDELCRLRPAAGVPRMR